MEPLLNTSHKDNSQHFLIFIFLCVLSILNTNHSNAAPNKRFVSLDDTELESLGILNVTIQDPQGYMWFGSDNGLVRYDGYNYTQFRHNPKDSSSLSSSNIIDLLVDHRDQLWVVTSAGVDIFAPKKEKFSHFPYVTLLENTPSTVWRILEDRNKNLWLAIRGGGLVRVSFDESHERTPSYQHFTHDIQNANSIASNDVRAIFEDNTGTLWIGTHDKGLDKFVPENNSFQHFRHTPDNNNSLIHNQVITITEDHQGELWIGTSGGGISRLNNDRNLFINYQHNPEDNNSIGANFVWDILEDKQHQLWIATDGGGLNLFNREDDNFHRYMPQYGDTGSIASSKIRSIYQAPDESLWFGLFPSGVSKLDHYASTFRHYTWRPESGNSLNKNLTNNEVLSVTQGQNNTLWVGTEKGLNALNLDTGSIRHFIHNKNDEKSIGADPILKVLEDSNDILWVSTWRAGLSRLNPGENEFIRYLPQPGVQNQLQHSEIWALYEDSKGELWIGTHEAGLYRYNRKKDEFIQYAFSENKLSTVIIGVFYEDSQGNFWIGSGLGLSLFNRENLSIQHFTHNKNVPGSISHGGVTSIKEDTKGNLWVSTLGGGVNIFDRSTKTFTNFREEDGLSDNMVSGIEEDKFGFIWFGTGNGLSRFDPNTKKFRNFYQHHGLPGNAYRKSAHTKISTGDLVFGSSKGLVIFNPTNISQNLTPPPVVITDIQVLNKSLKKNQDGSQLKHSISQIHHLTLNHNQSVFSFQFAALNYHQPESNQYAYKLVGFDDHWNFVGTRRWASYTNLDPGQYTFHVKATNNDGLWNEKGTELSLTILPPWWLTWWAYCIYLIIFFAVVALVFYTLWHKKRAENESKMIQRLQQIDKTKDDFLATTSHELRTPLNGIIGLSESLIGGVTGPLPQATIDNLNMIVSSGKRLANLVNDILDFSSLRENTISLHQQEVDIHSLTKVVMSLSLHLLGEKPILLVNKVTRGLPRVYVDENRLQQILYNLVGNAIKFTEEGEVTISAYIGDKHDHKHVSEDGRDHWLWINIQDTGIGISANKLNRIFDPFEQGDATKSRAYAGTGLGLAVSKQLIELHGGTIGVTSTPGKGSTFKFSLPIALESEYNTILNTQRALGLDDIKIVDTQEFPAINTEIHNTNGYHVLIVDDDPINRLVLSNFLTLQNYRHTECKNGEDALKLIQQKNDIDIILLDIMMPVLSGYDVCKEIRTTYSQTDLPVIFLSANKHEEDIRASQSVGGNDYLSKPVDRDELYARLNIHLELRDIKSKKMF